MSVRKKSTNNAIVTLSHDGRMAPKAYQSWESIKQTKLIMHSLDPPPDQVLNFPVSRMDFECDPPTPIQKQKKRYKV